MKPLRFDKRKLPVAPEYRSSTQIRETLGRLLEEHGQSRAQTSRLIGRSPSYLQRFMAGKIDRLPRDDARFLSRYFGVDERELGVSGAAEASR